MAEDKKYAYLVHSELGDTGIVYMWGAYYVAHILTKPNNRALVYTIRKYKTLRGAENCLLRDISYTKRTDNPDIQYGTEAFIREGSYWK